MATPFRDSEGNGARALRAAATPPPAPPPQGAGSRLAALRAARRLVAAEVVAIEEQLRSLQRGRDLATACRESRVASLVLRRYVQRRRDLRGLCERIRELEGKPALRGLPSATPAAPAGSGVLPA